MKCIYKVLVFNEFLKLKHRQFWHTHCFNKFSSCFKPGGMVMSEFNVLYRSLHRNQKITKPVEEKVSTSETESGSKPETPVNLFRALISKIF